MGSTLFASYAEVKSTRRRKKMGEIYKIINDFNDKVYIGKTMKTTEARKREHLCQLNDGTAIHQSMLKHGIEHFTWVPLEINIFDKELLAQRECYWIEYYNSYYNGYNMTLGGEGGNGTHARNLVRWREENPDKVIENTEKLLQWREDHSEEVKRANQKAAEIRKAKYGNSITQQANEATKKKVKCIETNKIYDSVTAAAQDIGGANGSHIGEVCNGKRKTAYKYHWEWTN